MKRMRKFVGILLTMVMVLAMTATAFAAEGYTITLKDEAGHTYEVYQIFTGDLHEEDGEKILSNVVWGNGVTDDGKTTLGGAKAKAEALTDTNAEAFAAEVNGYLQNAVTMTAGEADENGVVTYTASGLAAGYYLIKDQDGSLDSMAYTSYILKVVSDIDVKPKAAYPTVDKQVQDEAADAEEGAVDGWGEADHNIGESYQYKLIATLPADEDFADYETYKLVFHDTMSAGITFEEIVSVTVDGVAFEAYVSNAVTDKTTGVTTLTVTLANIKVDGVTLTDGAVVEVIYKAHLNDKAVVGDEDDNTNKVYLEYSNNPNASGSGEGGDDHETGKTEEDTVWVFTYELNTTKVDSATEEALAGAEFKLYRETEDGKEYAVLDEAGKLTGWGTEEKGSVLTSGADGKFKVISRNKGSCRI